LTTSAFRYEDGNDTNDLEDLELAQVTLNAEEEGGEDDKTNEENPDALVGVNTGGGFRANVPPSGVELKAIKDASELFRSGSFKMKVNIFKLVLDSSDSSSPD
jgi:U3 small nucleolar RNA-associated protein 22